MRQKRFSTSSVHPRAAGLKAIRQIAYCLVLRYSGQRISDVSMLGPDNLIDDNGNWFISLTQVKTGSFVKIPVPGRLAQRLQALPLRGAQRTVHFKNGPPNHQLRNSLLVLEWSIGNLSQLEGMGRTCCWGAQRDPNEIWKVCSQVIGAYLPVTFLRSRC